MNPKISVVLPFFRSERTLERAINSIVTQSFQKWELILVNDGSDDGSEQITTSFLVDDRIAYVYQENKGVSAARNMGASKTKGEWLIFLDSDDQLREGALQKIYSEIQNAKGIDFLVFGINRIKDTISQALLPVDGQYFSKIPGTFVIRKTMFDQVGGYDERFRFSENTELFHRLQLIKAKGKNIPWVSLNYYDNPSGGSKNLQNMVDSLTIILDKHADTLSEHVKHLYHQIIGVNSIRFRHFADARHHLWKAVRYKPQKTATWGRLGLACFPFIARRFYSEIVKHD